MNCEQIQQRIGDFVVAVVAGLAAAVLRVERTLYSGLKLFAAAWSNFTAISSNNVPIMMRTVFITPYVPVKQAFYFVLNVLEYLFSYGESILDSVSSISSSRPSCGR